MPLKTSFFNPGIFKSNLKRFWVVAFAYAFLLLLITISYLTNAAQQLEGNYNLAYDRQISSGILSEPWPMAILYGLFCLIAALCVFSYMHSPKSTAMIHALPAKRESLFTTNYLAGLSLTLVPVLFNGIILIAGGLLIGIPDLKYLLIWLLLSLIMNFLLYSFAVFAGLFTGHLAAQAVFYVIFNFLALFLEVILELVFQSFLFGFYLSTGTWQSKVLSPIVYMDDLFSYFAMNKGSFWAPVAYLLAGLVFTAAAFFLYKKRRMEVATDVISLKAMKPIFLYTVTFCSSALFGSILVELITRKRSIGAFVVSYMIGGFIGYFASLMLLKKTFRVFRHYKGYVVSVLAIIAAFSALYFDAFGYERYIPQINDIEMIYVSNYSDRFGTLALSPEQYDPEKDRYYVGFDFSDQVLEQLTGEMVTSIRKRAGIISDQASIQKVLALHQAIIDNRNTLRLDTHEMINQTPLGSKNIYFVNFLVTYRMKGGQIIERSYNLPMQLIGSDEMSTLLRDLVTTPELKDRYQPLLNLTPSDINNIDIGHTSNEGVRDSISVTNDIVGFLEAYKADILNQDPINWFVYMQQGNYLSMDVTFNLKEPLYHYGRERTYTIQLTTDYTNTLKYLEEHGLIKKELLQELKLQY